VNWSAHAVAVGIDDVEVADGVTSVVGTGVTVSQTEAGL
jgi:hypothetical protein